MARTKQPARGRTKEETSTKVEDEALVPTEQVGPIEAEGGAGAEDEASVPTESETPVEIEDVARAEDEALVAFAAEPALPEAEDEIQETRELCEEQLSSVAPATETGATSFQAIVAEMTDYSKRSVESASAFVKKLLGAKSFESAVHIQSQYAKSSYADFVTYVTKIGEIYSKLAKETFERRSHVA